MTSIARAVCRPAFARTLLARLLLWLALAAGSLATAQAQAPDPASVVGSWRSQPIIDGWLGFALDIAPTGDPARPLRATGHVGRDRLTASSCAGVPAAEPALRRPRCRGDREGRHSFPNSCSSLSRRSRRE